MANRGYKLQEFTAHTSRVSCLNIGKKSCRVFLTGGEDHKVNLWAIGKPTSLLSLSGHTSSVQSVTFDSAEVLVLGGSSNGTIKLWDLEEGKIVRTVTGHRANCISVDFHPFGEFFASGSVDTDLKIWDIRKKGCIHTYKGHTRGIRTIKFTPDGRWVVTGGEDNVVKLWDLTAGKLLHDFKFHCGPIQCIDFHPHEFLLATGSADRTVKFLDLETFELIGSAGPQVHEASGIRSMVFHPDGKTLFAGLDETLKVLSWEPIICHDIVEMGWSTLGDLGVYEGKLLGCSYYQSHVGVWVADISLIKPYEHGVMPKANSFVEPVYNHGDHHPIGPAMNDTCSALLVEGTPDCGINTKDAPKNPCIISNETCQRIIQGPVHSPNMLPMNSSRFRRSSSSVNSHSDPSKFDSRFSSKKSMNSATVRCGKPTEILAVAPSKSESNFPSRVVPLRSTAIHSISPSTLKNGAMVEKRSAKKAQAISRSVSLPFIVPRDSLEAAASYKKVTVPTEATHGAMHSKPCNMLKSSFVNDSGVSQPSETIFEPLSGIVGDTVGTGSSLLSRLAINTGTTSADENKHSSAKTSAEELKTSMQMDRTIDLHNNKSSELPCSSSESGMVKYVRGVAVPLGKTKSLVESWEKRERCNSSNSSNISTISSSDEVPKADNLSSVTKGQCQTSEVDVASADDHAVPEALLQSHDVFINVVKSRLTKLQVVRHFWEHNGIKGAVNAVAKLPDHSVQLDLVCILKKRIDLCTLDLFACLLPVLAGLINSKTERHIIVCLEMLLELVKIFGPTINSTLSASSLVGLDYQVEQRSECCKRCFNHLDKIQKTLPLLIRRGGLLGKHAQALTLLLNDL